ncbi:MAG: flagellar export protein FliJ [bacterium]|nr:flagellar export protein FliJ [bacterium]
MAKFNYRMQSILDIKYKLEEQEKMAYSVANQKLQDENQKLAMLMMKKAGYENEARELALGSIDIQKIQENKRAITTMKTLIRDQMMKVHVAEKNVELARKRLSDVMVDRKSHEKLREKAFDQFVKEEAGKEMLEIDQLVSFTHQSKQ